jgi:hypothetical protein
MYGSAVAALIAVASDTGPRVNLVLEAPLSVAFTKDHNPTMRSIERREAHHPRPWYSGAGATVLLAAIYMVRALHDAPRRRDVVLFEGFVSFKPSEQTASHMWDVLAMREIIRTPGSGSGRLLDGAQLKVGDTDEIESAFKVMGLQFGVPAVVELNSMESRGVQGYR